MRVVLHPGYKPHAYQRAAHASGARFLGLVAGVRGGKTKGAAVEFCRRIYKDFAAGRRNAVSGFGRRRRPAQHYWVVAPTAQLLREPLRYLYETLPVDLIEGHYPSDGQLWLVGDILIELRSADNPLHLVSTGLHGLWIDEAARLKADAWRGQLRQRLSDRAGWAIASTTPLGRNWFHEDWAAKSDPELALIQWRTIDNPAIPPAEIEAARRQLPGRYFRREYEASFDAFSGTVFDEWNHASHVLNEAQLRARYGWGNGRDLRSLFKRVLAGVDWGWNSPGAIVVVGQIGETFVVLEESYAANRIIFDARLSQGTWVAEARRLRTKWGVAQFFADPARPADIYDFVRAGLPCVGADNEVVFGVRKLSEAMHPREEPDLRGVQPRLYYLDACPNLIRETPLYVWAQTRDRSGFVDLPADGQSDHALDALRYVMVEYLKDEMPHGLYPSGGRRGPIG